MVVDEEEFARLIAERVAAVPGVLAVGLGGSRAQGLHRPDSDWDLGLYRSRLDPDDVRALDPLGCAGGLAPRFARMGGTPRSLRRAVQDVRTVLVAGSDPLRGHDG